MGRAPGRRHQPRVDVGEVLGMRRRDGVAPGRGGLAGLPEVRIGHRPRPQRGEEHTETRREVRASRVRK